MGLPPRVARDRAPLVLGKVGLTAKATGFTEDLSAGERQKANLARCLMTPRPIYLLDEPTVHMDAVSAEFIRRFIKEELISDGSTAILATHNIWEAEVLCDRIAILFRGRILTIDSPDTLKKRIGYECAILELTSCPTELQRRLGRMEAVSSVVLEHDILKLYGRSLGRNLVGIIDLCREYAEVNSVGIAKPTLTDIFIQLLNDAANGRT